MAVYFTPMQDLNPSLNPTNSYDSPPSLAYSDDTSEDFTLATMSSGRDDIRVIIDDALIKMARIVDHLRDHGQNEAANRCSRQMTVTFRNLYDTVALFNNEDCMMKSPNRQRFSPIETSNALQTLPNVPASNTWAAVAATSPEDGNPIIKYRPSDKLKAKAIQQEPGQPSKEFKDMRVAWVQPWEGNRPLTVITDSIKQFGAIYSIAYAPEAKAVCIIFQHAESATRFIYEHEEFVGRTEFNKYGPGISVLSGNPFPANEDIRRMDSPRNERRRLTFARQQLFSHEISEKQFKAHLEGIVGAANIELVWLFNIGNATVVFTGVLLARIVKNKFTEWSKQPMSPYKGVMVSYSHDPCERDIHLVTQIQDHPSNIGNYHNGHAQVPNERAGGARRQSNASSTAQRYGNKKSRTDADGWQTVGRKR